MKKNSLKILTTCLAASLMFAAPSSANNEVEKAVLDQIVENMTVTAKKLNDAQVAKCFSEDIYDVEIETAMPGGGATTRSRLYFKTADGVSEVTEPGTNAEIPALLDIVNPDFKLNSPEDGKAMLAALGTLYPNVIDTGVEQQVIQDGTTWSFLMGDFFDYYSGFDIETDDEGKITKISRNLKIKAK